MTGTRSTTTPSPTRLDGMKLSTKARKAIKYAILTAAGIALWHWASAAALIERGGRVAIGGEYLLLLLPLIWAGVGQTAKDVAELLAHTGGTAAREDKKNDGH